MNFAEALADRVTVETITNASHALIPEQPKAVAEVIVGWARGMRTPKAAA